MITAAVSDLLLTTNRDAFRSARVDSPLAGGAREVVFKLPNLRELRVIVNEADSLPTLVLPNLTGIDIEYDHIEYDLDVEDDCHCGWLQGFRGATLGKLASVISHSESYSIGGFLEAFESVALTTSIPATLSKFEFIAQCSWRPNYRSLLPFTLLTELVIEFCCGSGCPSTIDDDTIADLARAMLMLEILKLGDSPCKTPGGVTVKGLAILAYHSLHLSDLHFQVSTLDPAEIPAIASGGGSVLPREDCALTGLGVGDIHVPQESTLMVALTLVRVFPHLYVICWNYKSWMEIEDALGRSKQLVDCSSETLVYYTSDWR